MVERPTPSRSARGSHAIEAADGGDDVAEEERLDQALHDVGIAQVLPGHGEVLGAVLVVHEDGNGGAAEDAEASATMVRKKSMVMQAKMRGVTSLRMGSTPRARMASICSVTTMEPEFAGHGGGIAAGDHDAGEHRAQFADHGQATNWPVTAVAPNSDSVAADCSASTPPVKKPESRTMAVEPTPMMSD